VTGDEPFFRGHFPGEPVVPGVLIAEALAQLSGLVGLHDDGPRGRLAQADLRFDTPVIPPADIRLTSRLERSFGALRQFQVEARAGDAVAARGTLVLAVVGRDQP
jgi:3-hydroxyacyl-[acyl-carrier-protein] dehydratase